MNESSWLDLDGRQLQLLLAVCEERSITRAAERLGLTQPAVSHALARLRAITADALLVRSGRGVVPTARGEALARQARALLPQLRGFADGAAFDPLRLVLTLGIAANPLQRDLLLPPLFARLQAAAPGLSLRVVNSDVPSAALLRDDACHLVVTPRPPDAADVVQQRLFEDRYVLFHDAAAGPPPRDRAAYEAADHVTVRYESRGALEIDRLLAQRGVHRRLVVQVSDFAGVAPFLRGTRRVATLPSRLAGHALRGLQAAPVPVPTPPMPMFALWHQRHQHDPMHRWLRGELQAVAASVVATAAVAAPAPG